MTVRDLDDMTPKQFLNAQIGFQKFYELQEQSEWERARWISCVIINPHLKKGISPGKITTFPWEHKRKAKKRIDIEKLQKESILDDKIQEFINNKIKEKDA